MNPETTGYRQLGIGHLGNHLCYVEIGASDLAIYNTLARTRLDHNLEGKIMKPRFVLNIVTIILAAALLPRAKKGGKPIERSSFLRGRFTRDGTLQQGMRFSWKGP